MENEEKMKMVLNNTLNIDMLEAWTDLLFIKEEILVTCI
jgi:hypothetical protein